MLRNPETMKTKVVIQQEWLTGNCLRQFLTEMRQALAKREKLKRSTHAKRPDGQHMRNDFKSDEKQLLNASKRHIPMTQYDIKLCNNQYKVKQVDKHVDQHQVRSANAKR